MPASDLRFLVVEDHPFQRTVMVRLLQTMGAAAVHEADDGAAALAVIRDPARPVDVVITDLSMPGMDGMEFVRRLSELGTPVSLILASAVEPQLLSTVATMARAYRVRMLGVVGKPPTVGQLAPLIDLHRNATPDPETEAAGVPLEELATSWTNHDFDPWFEPVVEIATGTLRCLHASPRWRHPERGSLGPETFLPSVRARGLWDEFAWMLVEASAEAATRWRARAVDAAVSIPLLFETCADADLAHRITRVVTGVGLEPRDALLIVSPAAIAAPSATVLENLARLRLDGFSLALEQGAGEAVAPAALGAFTDLRLPSSALEGAGTDGVGRDRLAAALQLARSAGLRATVAGVADSGQWDALRQLGCDLAHGPMVGPAMGLDAVVAWARRRAAASPA